MDDPADAAAALHAAALDALAASALDDARALIDQARAGFVAACGDDHPDVAGCDTARARIEHAASAFADAFAFATRAAGALEQARYAYPDEPVILELLAAAASQQGAALVALGRYDDAEACILAVLPSVEAALGADAAPVGALCNGLGVCHKYQARWDDAAARYERAYRIAAAHADDDTAELATLEHNLGGLAHARGEPAIAEPHARCAVVLRAQARGPDHPEVAADLAAWAAVLDDLGRADDAERAYRRALAIFEATLGADHFEVGFTRGALGALLAGAERWDEARVQLEAALAGQRALLGDSHPDVALLHHYLAVVEHGRGRFTVAALHAQRADLAFSAVFPVDHPRVIDARSVRAAIHGQLAWRA